MRRLCLRKLNFVFWMNIRYFHSKPASLAAWGSDASNNGYLYIQEKKKNKIDHAPATKLMGQNRVVII